MLELLDIFDVKFLQKYQDAFSNATGMASIITDLNGPITNPSNFTDFCIKLTRGSKEGFARCNACDLKAGKESSVTSKPAVYFCHAGLMDFGAPIMVDGQQIGSILGGQVLTAKPDEAKFRKIAREIGIDEDEYIRALNKIKIVPENQIRNAAELLHITMEQITRSRVQYKKLRDSYSSIEEKTNAISDKIQNLNKNLTTMSSDQKLLLAQVEIVLNIIKKIDAVVKAVALISEETQMISINASIEAARSGLEGRSFAIIAQEIKRLASKSKDTVKQIEGFTTDITKSVREILATVQFSDTTIKDEIKNVDDIFPTLNSILTEMNKLGQ